MSVVDRSSATRRYRWSLLGLLFLSQFVQALGGDFTLTANKNHSFALQDLRGKVVVLSFGYTSCPDVCPTALATLSAALRNLGDSADQVQGVFISLDPERDTPERLTQYVRFFHPDLIGVSGSDDELRKAAADYRVRFNFVGRGERENYTLDHSANLYLLDANGKLVSILPHGLPATALVDSIKATLADS